MALRVLNVEKSMFFPSISLADRSKNELADSPTF